MNTITKIITSIVLVLLMGVLLGCPTPEDPKGKGGGDDPAGPTPVELYKTALKDKYGDKVVVVSTNAELKAAVVQELDGGTRVNDVDTTFNNIDTSAITDMSNIFIGKTDFNSDISGWYTSNVTDMNTMFQDAKKFNQNIGAWDTSNVTDMTYMFDTAEAFNNGGSGDIGKWNTSNVTNMTSMFNFAKAFNQDIGNWNTGKVEDMSFMFARASEFNQDLSRWKTDSIKTHTDFTNGTSNTTFVGNTAFHPKWP